MLHRLHLCVAVNLVFVLIQFTALSSGNLTGLMNHERAKEKPLWSSKFLESALRKLSLSNGGEKTVPRQAIPLAMVQADALASAKQSKKPDKSNSTDNCTVSDKHANMTCNNETMRNDTIQSVHDNKTLNAINKTVHLLNASMDTRDRKSVTRHAGVIFISNVTYRENPTTNESSSEVLKFERCTNSHAILVGPLDSLPQDPNGNGPQDKQAKENGTFKRKDPDKPQNRTKRESGFHSGLRQKKAEIFPYPYVVRPPASRFAVLHPQTEVDERPMRRADFNTDDGRLFKLSQEGMTDAGIVDNTPSQDSAGIDPQLMQSAYEKRAFWDPIQDQSFNNGDQLDLGSPDHSYRRFVEKEAMNVDRSFSQDFPLTPEGLLMRNLARRFQYRQRSTARRPSRSEAFQSLRGGKEAYPDETIQDRGIDRSRMVNFPSNEEMQQFYSNTPQEMLEAARRSRSFMSENSEMQQNMLPGPAAKFLLPVDSNDYPARPDQFLGDQENEMGDRRAQLNTANVPSFNPQLEGGFMRPAEVASMFHTVVDPANALFSPSNPLGMPERLPLYQDLPDGSSPFLPTAARVQDEQERLLPLQPILTDNNIPMMSETRNSFSADDNDPEQRRMVSSPTNSDLFPSSPSMFRFPVQPLLQSASNFAAGQLGLTQQALQNYYVQAMQAQQMANQDNSAAFAQPYQSNPIDRRTMLQSLASVPVVMAISQQGTVLPSNIISSLLAQTSQRGQQEAQKIAVNSNQRSTTSNGTAAERKGSLMTFTTLPEDEAQKVDTEHKELVSPDANLNNKKSEDGKLADVRKDLNGQVVTLSLEKAIRDVLADSLHQKKITSEQFSDIEGKVRSVFSDLTKNGTTKHPTNVTVVNATVPSNSSSRVFRTTVVARKDDGISLNSLSSCKDQIKECPRFKEGGVCPFMETFMEGMCTKTCGSCQLELLESGEGQAMNAEKKDQTKKEKGTKENCSSNDKDGCNDSTMSGKAPPGASMHLDFDSMESETVVIDISGNANSGVLLKGAKISNRRLGTCGKAAEVNGGDVSWSGRDFKKKPVGAVSLGMWVKVKKSGSINWFANGKAGKTFYLSTQGTVVPAKVWTHVVGTYDSKTGLSRVFINGDLAQETQQTKGEKLMQDWLVNGIGKSFGDDSIHYVDEIYIYDRALSPNEVHALYSQCQFNRMVIHYGFQKGNMSSIKDQSGLQNDAILIGGALPKDDCDRCGACLDMTEGPNPTLKIERISLKNLPTTGVSVAFWVSLNSTSGIHDLFTTQGRFDDSGYHLQVVDGKIKWRIGADNGDVIFDYETGGIVVPEALWSHVIVTYGSQTGKVRIYVNGISKFDKTVEKAKRRLLPQDWENEAKIGGQNFQGYLDEFLLYNWELDQSEAIYVRNYCADRPKLVRFTVRVPLTRRNKINNAKGRKDARWQRRSSVARPVASSATKTGKSKINLMHVIHSRREN